MVRLKHGWLLLDGKATAIKLSKNLKIVLSGREHQNIGNIQKLWHFFHKCLKSDKEGLICSRLRLEGAN
jgi:hypothetical protein